MAHASIKGEPDAQGRGRIADRRDYIKAAVGVPLSPDSLSALVPAMEKWRWRVCGSHAQLSMAATPSAGERYVC